MIPPTQPHRHTLVLAHTHPNRLRGRPKLLTVQRNGAAWISHVCIFMLSPTQRTPAAIDRTHTIFLYSLSSPLSLLSPIHLLILSLSFPLPASLPPSLPSCLSRRCSQRPFRAYLTKQHTTHAAYLLSPLSLPLSEKTEILNLAAAAMSHDLTTPSLPPSLLTLSLTPPPPPPPPLLLSTYNSSAICR